MGEVRSFATYFDEYASNTRAWPKPTDYVAYENGAQPIGIAFTQNGKEPLKGFFYYGDGNWHLKVLPPAKEDDIKENEDYYLYGYIPYLPAIRYSITDYNGGSTDVEENADYNEGAIIKLENVPTVLGKDLCVVIGAKHGFDQDHDGDYEEKGENRQYDEGVDTRTNRLRRGDFAYTAKAISKAEGGAGNYVFLLFDHLYAALTINMRVYADYFALRRIKLKELRLSTKAGETTSLDHNTITITLYKTLDASTDPIQTITYTPTGNKIGSGDDNGIEFWKSEAATGQTLITDYQPFSAYFMPIGITTLVLTSVYDVYDTEDNLIRENCKVTNTMELSELWTGQTMTRRGYKYTVDMTIEPTYLYVLSEPDLDNPTATIE
jgi:hypothetical protein